jgi:type IV secretory pathway TrbL component
VVSLKTLSTVKPLSTQNKIVSIVGYVMVAVMLWIGLSLLLYRFSLTRDAKWEIFITLWILAILPPPLWILLKKLRS